MQGLVTWFDYKILILGFLGCAIWAVASTIYQSRKKK